MRLYATQTLCAVCLLHGADGTRLHPAFVYADFKADAVILRRQCPQHGDADTIVSSNIRFFAEMSCFTDTLMTGDALSALTPTTIVQAFTADASAKSADIEDWSVRQIAAPLVCCISAYQNGAFIADSAVTDIINTFRATVVSCSPAPGGGAFRYPS